MLQYVNCSDATWSYIVELVTLKCLFLGLERRLNSSGLKLDSNGLWTRYNPVKTN